MRTRTVLTIAALVTLLIPSLARGLDVSGVLTNDSSAVQVDSVLWQLSTSPEPILELTPDWGGQVPMTDTFEFQPLEEWPSAVELFYRVETAPGSHRIDPLERNQLYALPVPGSYVMFTDSFTGITEGSGPATLASLRASPNPLAGSFATVRYSLPGAGPAVLLVWDVTGRTALEQPLAAARTGTVSLDLRRLSAGVYLVKVTTEGFSATQKLVVQR
jgi:hypothetical protein